VKCEEYPHRIAFNILPQIGGFQEFGFTTEEWKMDRETKKMLHDDSIRIVCTAVRVPVFNGHSESVYIETERPIPVERAREILEQEIEFLGPMLVRDVENAQKQFVNLALELEQAGEITLTTEEAQYIE